MQTSTELPSTVAWYLKGAGTALAGRATVQQSARHVALRKNPHRMCTLGE
jgi:hypothetical protein